MSFVFLSFFQFISNHSLVYCLECLQRTISSNPHHSNSKFAVHSVPFLWLELKRKIGEIFIYKVFSFLLLQACRTFANASSRKQFLDVGYVILVDGMQFCKCLLSRDATAHGPVHIEIHNAVVGILFLLCSRCRFGFYGNYT